MTPILGMLASGMSKGLDSGLALWVIAIGIRVTQGLIKCTNAILRYRVYKQILKSVIMG